MNSNETQWQVASARASINFMKAGHWYQNMLLSMVKLTAFVVFATVDLLIRWMSVVLAINRCWYWWSWGSETWWTLHLLSCHERSLLSPADTRQFASQSSVCLRSLSAAWCHTAGHAENWLWSWQVELDRCVANAGWDICKQWHRYYCVFSVSKLLHSFLHCSICLVHSCTDRTVQLCCQNFLLANFQLDRCRYYSRPKK